MKRKASQTTSTSSKRPRIKASSEHAARPTTVKSVPSMQKQDTNRREFSDLVGELRKTIYEHALSPHSGQAIRLNAGPDPTAELALGILATSKAIRNEALGIFVNRLRIDSVSPVSVSRSWLSIPQEKRPPEPNPDCNTLPKGRVSIKALGPKLLSAARCFTFALYAPPPSIDATKLDRKDLPEITGVVLKLNLLRAKPFYSLGVVFNQSKADPTYLRVVQESVSLVCEDIFQVRRVKGLALNDIMDIAGRLATF